MAVRRCLLWPDTRLRTRAAPVEAITDEIRAIWTDMIDTMEAMPGVGLAAPQIGVMVRLAVVDASDARGLAVRMANPDILHASIELRSHEEASPNLPGVSAAIFGPLSEAGVNVDMIVQNIAEDGRTDMTFSLPVDQVARAGKAVQAAKDAGTINFHDLIADEGVSKVSVVGIGMRSHAGVAARMFKALSDEGINIKVITTSEIKISVLIDRKYMELAVQTLHDAFGLERA